MADKKIRIGSQQVTVSENALDRAIAYISPTWGNRRFVSRARSEVMALAGGHRGASRSRRQMANYNPQGGSADAEDLPDLPTLRDRTRDLVRNAPMATGAIATVVTNVVGTGLMVRPTPMREILGWSEEQAAVFKRAVTAEFKLWAESKCCDASRAQNFYGLQDLALRSTLENGDTFPVLKMLERGAPYALAILMIEADRVSNKDGAADKEGERAGGVVVDENGAALKYQITKAHPGALGTTQGKREWVEIEAYGATSKRRNILHLFMKKRIGQTRGLPMLSPVIELLKQMSDLSEAELFAAVLNSMIAVVTKTEDRGGLSPLESATQNAVPESGTGDGAQGDGWDGKLQAGLAVDLGLNEEVKSFMSGRPNPEFEGFFNAMVAQLGVALELPHEVLMKKFMASYSAARGAMLEAWKLYRKHRAWLAGEFCQPVYEEWMAEAVARNRIDAPGFFDDARLRYAYTCACWHGDGPGSIDPQKEVLAAKERLLLNLRTLAQEVAEDTGGDVEEVIETRGREVKLLEAAGLSAPGSKAFAAVAGGAVRNDPAAADEPGAPGAPAGSDQETAPAKKKAAAVAAAEAEAEAAILKLASALTAEIVPE